MRRSLSKIDLQREIVWRKCASDPWYFITNFVKVLAVGKGYQTFDLWDHQPEIIQWMHSKHTDEASWNGALKARQVGWTTIGNAFALWSMFFHPNHPWLQVSVGQDEAADALSSKITTPYSMLPAWMRLRGPKVVRDTNEQFGFDNGSSMLAIPSTSRSGRSRAVYGCLFDEAAFMVEAGDVFAGVEPMVYGPIFVFSTANGMGNFFHETWVEALADDSVWDMKFYDWSVVPGRDEVWYELKKRAYRGKEHLFYQEYPANPGEAFMRSGRTAFDIEFLEENQDWSPPLFRLDATLLDFHKHHDDRIELSMIPAGETRDLEFHVWEEPYVERDADGLPIRKPNYGIGVDVAEGLEHGDYSAISVRNINTGSHVASLRAHVPIFDLGSLVETIGYWYHSALVGVERNNFGLVPLQYLQDNGYPRLYRMDSIAEVKRSQRTPRYGWITSRTTKPKMVQDMALAISVDTVRLHDRRWLQEATTFVSTGTGRYEASPPNTDDLMIAELIAHQMELDVGRFPNVWRDPIQGPMTFGDVFTLMSYADGDGDQSKELDRPIGQPQSGSVVRKSFPMKVR
jgi:hypothetical protein